jgi:hypothetical protein
MLKNDEIKSHPHTCAATAASACSKKRGRARVIIMTETDGHAATGGSDAPFQSNGSRGANGAEAAGLSSTKLAPRASGARGRRVLAGENAQLQVSAVSAAKEREGRIVSSSQQQLGFVLLVCSSVPFFLRPD